MLKKLATFLASATIVLTSLGTVPAGATSPNIIPNPSLEIAQDTSTPQGWNANTFGTNSTTFSYLNTGHTGTRSIEVQVANYTDGAADWAYNDVPVAAGTTYQYENWYQSNVDTEVDAEVLMSDNTFQYVRLGTVLANANWTKYTTTFTVPTGAKGLAVYQILAKNGFVITDDYSLSVYTPVPFNRAIISVSFDDGWASQFTNAYPILQQYAIPGTFNIISGTINTQSYLTLAHVQTLSANNGNEIASHSVSHPDLTTETAAQIDAEMKDSQAALQADIGKPVTDFAYPYGAYNAATIATGQQYYVSQRTVDAGFNTKDNFNASQLKIEEVDSNISVAQVEGWIDSAIANKAWLILVYHEVATTPVDPTDALYTTQPADFTAEMTYLHGTNAATETVHDALQEASAQLGTIAPPLKPGDVNGDDKVNAVDLSIMASHWGLTSGATRAQGDLNGDGRVNAIDLSILSSNWGK